MISLSSFIALHTCETVTAIGKRMKSKAAMGVENQKEATM